MFQGIGILKKLFRGRFIPLLVFLLVPTIQSGRILAEDTQPGISDFSGGIHQINPSNMPLSSGNRENIGSGNEYGSLSALNLSDPAKHLVRGRLLSRGGPLSAVQVSTVGQTVTTDEEGWYSFSLPDGAYTLVFEVGEEYFPRSQEIEVSGADLHLEALYLNRILWRYEMTGSTVFVSPEIGPDGCSYLLIRLKQTSQLREIGPDGALRRMYEFDSPNATVFTRAHDGTFYIPSYDVMIAVNPDFTLKWEYSVPEGGLGREPVVGPDGSICFGSYLGTVYALNPNGTLRWNYSFSDRMEIIPAIGGGGTVYVPGCDGTLYAFHPDGVLKWTHATGGRLLATPLIGQDGIIYFGSTDNFFYSLIPDGSLRWKYDTGSPIRENPLFGADGTIHTINENGEILALNPDGSLRWKRTGDGCIRIWIYPPTGEIWAWLYSLGEVDVAALKPTGEMKWKQRIAMGIPSCSNEGKIRLTMHPDVNSRTFYFCEVEMGEYSPNPPIVDSVGEDQRDIPGMLSLYPNTPNPFNPSTTIRFALAAPHKAILSVYDISGQKIRTLVSDMLNAGEHSVIWDGRDDSGMPVSSGVYLSRLQSGGRVATGKMLLVK